MPKTVIPTPPVSDEQLAQLKLAALYHVNQIRLELGGEPIAALPKGQIGCNRYCVIAKALADLGTEVKVIPRHTKLHRSDGEWREIRHPEALTMFIRLFDRHHYPELEVRWTTRR